MRECTKDVDGYFRWSPRRSSLYWIKNMVSLLCIRGTSSTTFSRTILRSTVFEALWAYNLDPDDLSFAARDVISVVEETNARGKGTSLSWLSAARSNVSASPPPGAGTNSVGPQQDPGQKSKFGNYGNMMVHSTTGGVGFGAAAAIGSGLVRVIF
ncbi:hypothetical protein ARMGADRAFT_1019625 [Armillaria gallica]|uniref:Uncharacterized protein n=1 Tax=Armillaria gallica TaxID=47427 RepID=A0A2H3CHC6_ARMGA|nr:hypothetical protein ARMGADRAFT_1019625 [Armillaria gallica]